MKRFLFSIVTIIILMSFVIVNLNGILIKKDENRYYMLSKELENIEEIDVQIYGSCHAYTSFDAKYFSDAYGYYAYNMANPSEIIPVTYLQMLERFEKDIPKVAIVEIWGINVYETYLPTDEIFDAMKLDVENIPFSLEKQLLISDFNELSFIGENFCSIKYRNRLYNGTISSLDFNYSYENAKANYDGEAKWMYDDMDIRFSNNGYLINKSNILLDYSAKQAKVGKNSTKAVEKDIIKYLDKIIDLCKEKNVKLIFYRAPYISCENELKKVNYIGEYLMNKEVPFYNLEELVEFDYQSDFDDYYHLSSSGAKKATNFLAKHIVKILEEN